MYSYSCTVLYSTNDCGCGCGRRTGCAFVVSRLRGASWQPKAGTQGTRAHTHTESKCVCERRSTGGVDTRREDTTTGGGGEGAHQPQRERADPASRKRPACDTSVGAAVHSMRARARSRAHTQPRARIPTEGESACVTESEREREIDHCCRQLGHAAHPELAPAAADTERRCRGRRQRRCSIEMVAT